jgi:hypothetical protein
VRAKNSSGLCRLETIASASGRTALRHIEGSGSVRSTFELLIDCGKDRVLSAMLVGMLREPDC